MLLWILSAAKKPSFHQGVVEMGLDIYHSSSNLTKLLMTKPGRTQTKQQNDFSSYPQVSTGPRATDASGIDVRMELGEAQSELWNTEELFPKH